MEDLIEEIVGDVRDEHDEPELDVQRVGDGWSCSGLLRIDEVTSATGYTAPEGDYDTLVGWCSPNWAASPTRVTRWNCPTSTRP